LKKVAELEKEKTQHEEEKTQHSDLQKKVAEMEIQLNTHRQGEVERAPACGCTVS